MGRGSLSLQENAAAENLVSLQSYRSEISTAAGLKDSFINLGV